MSFSSRITLTTALCCFAAATATSPDVDADDRQNEVPLLEVYQGWQSLLMINEGDLVTKICGLGVDPFVETATHYNRSAWVSSGEIPDDTLFLSCNDHMFGLACDKTLCNKWEDLWFEHIIEMPVPSERLFALSQVKISADDALDVVTKHVGFVGYLTKVDLFKQNNLIWGFALDRSPTTTYRVNAVTGEYLGTPY